MGGRRQHARIETATNAPGLRYKARFVSAGLGASPSDAGSGGALARSDSTAALNSPPPRLPAGGHPLECFPRY